MIGRFGVMSETQSNELGYKSPQYSDGWWKKTMGGFPPLNWSQIINRF